ncbi:DUF4191 domain-containing protein [Schaalia turicensis]|uniref:DUF4191 domain-containing protein n=1 Tax=Schaalia turicensis TaxID=131111 RepID=UPI0036996489
MAQDKNKGAKKKPGFFKTLRDAFTIAKRTYKHLGWWLALAGLAGLGIGILLGFLTKSWIAWAVFGILLMLLLPMLLLTRAVRSASYAQLDGMPGATSAILDSLRGSWVKQTEPVRFNARHQDFVFRLIGRPGVVLVAEGPISRTRKLIDDERRAIRRVAPNAPVHAIFMGNGEGQVPLAKLERAIKKLKKEISAQEVSALSQRLDALGNKALNIPKGIDPTNIRANRRALRGQ